MDLGSAFEVSASGLRAQRMRLDVIASNLANANSSASESGGPYRRRDVVLQAEALAGGFGSELASAGRGMGVEVSRVVEDQNPPRMVFDPGHPEANEDGYLALPNIDVMSEMADLMAATRAYEANVAAVQATKRVLQAALEIGNER